MDLLEALPPIRKGMRIGVDLGKRRDPSAIIVAEIQLRDYTRRNPATGEHGITGEVTGGDNHYVVHHVGRLPLGTPYPAVVERLKVIYEAEKSRTQPRTPAEPNRLDRVYPPHRTTLQFECLVDATGLGDPVIDMLRRAGMDVTPVFLTGGDKAIRQHGELRLSKTLMVSNLQVLLQEHRVHLPKTSESDALVDELLTFEIHINDKAHVETGAFKVGVHDDLAVSLGLATWDSEPGQLVIGSLPGFSDYRGG